MDFPILVTAELANESLGVLARAGLWVNTAHTQQHWAATRHVGLLPKVRAVVTNGSSGLSAAQMDALPSLEIICAMGPGYENIDLAAARARNIVVTHGLGTNETSVADHAMALLLAVVRGIPAVAAAVRGGRNWDLARGPRPAISGKRLGILGLGKIGAQIARRGSSGFDMEVAYHNRRPRADVVYTYRPSPVALAEWCDFFVVATPGGEGTRHLVDRSVLDALGADGFLVNVGCGSVVDTTALTAALQERRIAGAGLDVIEEHPNVPVELERCANLVHTPRIAGRSPETVSAMARLVAENIAAHFAGRPVLTPVPGAPAAS